MLQELGLRDAAIIDAWVALPEVEAEEQPLVAEGGEEGEDPGDAPPIFALPSLDRRTYPRMRATLTPDDLKKAARVHLDNDISFDMQGEYLPNGMEVNSPPFYPFE
jgi:hypothetical protein